MMRPVARQKTNRASAQLSSSDSEEEREPVKRGSSRPISGRKEDEIGARRSEVEDSYSWRKRYLKLQEMYDDGQKKIRDLQLQNLQLTKELKETKEALDREGEKFNAFQKALGRIKDKLAVLQNSKQKDDNYLELERDNKKLQSELNKLKSELDRTRDQDGLIPHYRVAIMKMRSQNNALRERIDAQAAEAQAQAAKFKEETASLHDTIAEQKRLIDQLQQTIAQQREDYNLHLQAALELATAPEIQGKSDVEDVKPVITTFSSSTNKSKKNSTPGSVKSNYSTPKQSYATPAPQPIIEQPAKKDMYPSIQELDEEIEELQRSLERATQKLGF